MSKAFGNSNEEAYNQATALAALTGDVASFYNLSTDEAFTKLKAVYTGETEALKSLGVVMTQAALDEFAMAQGYGKTTKEMSEQEKVALRLAFVQDRLATASGDFSRTSTGWANQTRVLALRFDALKASIGQGLIAALRPVVVWLNKIMVYLQAAADAFSNFMTSIFGSAGNASSGASSLGDALASGSGELADNMDSAAGTAKKIKKSLAGFDQINILSSGSDDAADAGTGSVGAGSTSLPTDSIESGLNNGASAAGKLMGFLDEIKTKLIDLANVTGLSGLWDDFLLSVGNVKSGVLTLFDIFKDSAANVAPNFEALKSSFSNTFTTIFQTVTGIMGDMWVSISGGFSSFIEENRGEIETALSNYMAQLMSFWTFISDVVGDIFASVRDWWEADGKRIFDEMVGVIKDIGAWILEIWNTWISPVIDTIAQVLTDLWNNNLKPLWDECLALITSVWDALKAFYDTFLKPIIDWIIEKIGPVFTATLNNVVKVVGNAVATIVDIAKNIIKSIRGVLDFVTGVFKGDWEKAWGGIKTYFLAFDGIKEKAKAVWNAIKSAWSGVGQWFKNIGTNVKEAFTAVWSKLKTGASDAWSGIKSTFSNISTWFRDKFSDAWTKVKNVFSTGGKIFSGIKDGIVDAFKKVVNAIISGINKVIAAPFNGINSVLDKLRDFKILGAQPFANLSKINVPQIPQLASGGYVKANTPQLAIIGDNKREGEIVAPESKITEAVVAAFRQFMPM
ncbi:MAG: hypothetical protein IKZ36_02785, partial [Kiritimatiellae bacterium]|nr:hypothetical protein [Kiritimatiellia bacterium]